MTTFEVKARIVLTVSLDEVGATVHDAETEAEDILRDLSEVTDVDITDAEVIDSDESEDEAA